MNHMNHCADEMHATSTPGAFGYMPAKEENTPVKSQPSVLYYFSQNQTPLNRLNQLSGRSKNDAGPQLKTPGSACSGRIASHVFHSSKIPSSSKSMQRTGACRNPFEDDLVDALHGPMFSPNVFKSSTPSHTGPAKFQWSIDDIAVLKPADIEEPCGHDPWNFGGINPEVEERAQRAIDRYFTDQVILPSPWTNSSKKKPFVLPATPGGGSFIDSPMIFSASRTNVTPPKSSVANKDKVATEVIKREAASQTMLTLPIDFDLEAILKAHYVHHENEARMAPPGVQNGNSLDDDDGGSQDMLSNSSLRRKLFFHGDAGTPISPVRHTRNQCEGSLSSSLSQIDSSQVPLCSSGCDGMKSPNVADLSRIDHFSSSPIKVLHTTPTFRRCSTAPLLIDSPGVSPIRVDDRTGISNTCGSSKMITNAVDGTSYLAPSTDLRQSPLSHSALTSAQTPVSYCTGFPRRNLSVIDASFETESCGSSLGLPEPQDNRVKQPSPAERLEEREEPESVWTNFGDVVLRYTNAVVNQVDETTSMSQDPIPYDSQNGCLTAVSADTGYQSNFLQLTGAMSSNGTTCFSAHYDSILPSVLAEDMSCDSSFMNMHQRLIHNAASQGKQNADCLNELTAGGDNDRKGFALTAFSLGALHNGAFQNADNGEEMSCNTNIRNRSYSQPDLLLSCPSCCDETK